MPPTVRPFRFRYLQNRSERRPLSHTWTQDTSRVGGFDRKSGTPLADARGSEPAARVCRHLPSRDSEGAVGSRVFNKLLVLRCCDEFQTTRTLRTEFVLESFRTFLIVSLQ